MPRPLIAAPALFLAACLLFAEGDPASKPPAGAQPQGSAAAGSSAPLKALDPRQRAIHALNRLTFGPRPGDLDRVLALGVDKWIEQQLNPERIDDSALEARISGLLTWKMSTQQIVESFPPRPLIRAVAEGRRPMPRDADEQLIYQTAMRRFREMQANKQEAGSAGLEGSTPDSKSPDSSDPNQQNRERQRLARQEARRQVATLSALNPRERLRAFAALSLPELQALNRLRPGEKAALIADFTPRQRELMLALVHPELVVTTELQQGKLLRAIYSERQLQEVMTDFWMNHFNVFIGKGIDRYLITSYERDVVRPRALGKFQDLLIDTAQSPAMLWYLDNWQSVGPHSPVGEGRMRFVQRPNQLPRGLNENYARELMELHTLGVDGGYTQQDVTELARVLTGWTIEAPRFARGRGGEFIFRPQMHEPGSKVVLGKTFKEDGENEGIRALEMLAHQPATAHFISRKLAMRFVSDDPPPALVERMARTFSKSDGDIRAVLRTMFHSPEFWSPLAYRAKVKTPLEFVVSAVRAGDGDVQHAQPLAQALNRMGMPPYGSQPPTGYSMKSESWVSSAALLARINFALALGSGRLPGTRLPIDQLLAAGQKQPPGVRADSHDAALDGDASSLPDARSVQAKLERVLLMSDVSPQTHAAIAGRLTEAQPAGRPADDSGSMNSLAVVPAAQQDSRAGIIAGLLFGSPEFQHK